jgi:hypothetical protein
MDVTMLIGFAGGLAVLMSFAGMACGRLSARSTTYHAMNLTGALAMVAAGLPAGAWPSVAVNVSWALVSAHGLARAVTPSAMEREPLTDEHSVPAL